MSEDHSTNKGTFADAIRVLGYDPCRRNVSVLHGTEADEMPPDVAEAADRDRDLIDTHAADIDALLHRLAYLESELERIRPVYEAACVEVDRDGPLLVTDRRRCSLSMAVDRSRGLTTEQAIEAALR